MANQNTPHGQSPLIKFWVACPIKIRPWISKYMPWRLMFASNMCTIENDNNFWSTFAEGPHVAIVPILACSYVCVYPQWMPTDSWNSCDLFFSSHRGIILGSSPFPCRCILDWDWVSIIFLQQQLQTNYLWFLICGSNFLAYSAKFPLCCVRWFSVGGSAMCAFCFSFHSDKK